MTALELLKYQLEGSGKQLSRVIVGIDESSKDFKLREDSMTLEELVTHLGETYTAVLTGIDGGKYEWGTYRSSAPDWASLIAETFELRTKAVAAVLVEDDAKLQMGSDYMIFHDLYHVGQIASMRLSLYPTWDIMEMYE